MRHCKRPPAGDGTSPDRSAADHRPGGRAVAAGLPGPQHHQGPLSRGPGSAGSEPHARAATASTAPPTSGGFAPSSLFSATSTCRWRSSASAWTRHPSARALASRRLASGRLGSSPSLKREDPVYTLEELCETAGIDVAFLRLLIEYRLIDRHAQQGPVFTESDLETARICQLLARFGVEPRNLRLLGFVGGARGGARGADHHAVAALDAPRQARVRREDGRGSGKLCSPS